MIAIVGKLKSLWRSLAKALSHKNSHLPDPKTILAAAEGNVMNTGKRYRKTSDHSPFYSLFTFFGLRS